MIGKCVSAIKQLIYRNPSYMCTKRCDGTMIYVPKTHRWSDHFCKKFAENEPFSNMKMRELLKTLKVGSFIVDVGAHVGDTGLYLALHLQRSYPERCIDVIMIEPDHTKVDFVKKAVQLNNLTNCVILNAGVSDHTGKCGLIKNEEFPGATLVDEKADMADIPVYPIDHICNGMNVSMMHVDVEGMEHKCLLGAKRTLHNTQHVIIEMNEIPPRPSDPEPPGDRQREREFLKQNGFVQVKNENMYKEYCNELYSRP